MNDFFDLIANFFAELTNEEKILLGIIFILVFLIGVIVGWIVQGSKTRRYKKELLLLRKDRDEYEVRYRAGETKQKALAKEIEAMSREKVAALDRLQALEAETTAHDGLVAQFREENESLRASVEELNQQVSGLEAENERLQTTAAVPRESSPDPGPEAGAGRGTSNGNDSLNAYIAHNEARFQSLEDRLIALAQENAVLKSQGETAPTFTRGAGTEYVVQDPVPNTDPSTPYAPATEPLVIRADTTEAGVRTGQTGDTEVIVQTKSSIQVPPLQMEPDAKYDDLTRIKDIGPFLQAELNKADIFTYEQIAKWTEADIITYTELIGYLPGIIQRDDWVGQAQRLLAETPTTAITQADLTADYVPEPEDEAIAEDDLRIVEGIGPKIETVLKASGITTLNALAESTTERLRDILDNAGSRFKSHDPKTWPVQAGLAADGNLEKLRAWQRELKAG